VGHYLTSHPHPSPLPSRERRIGESIGGTLFFFPPISGEDRGGGWE